MRLHQLADLVAAYLLLVSLDTAEANNGKKSKKSNGNGGGKPKIRQGNGVIKPFPGQGNGSSNSRRANLDVSGLGSSLGDKDTIELELLPGQGSRKFKFEEHPGKSKANGQGKSWYGRTERGSGRGMTLNLLESDETNLDGSPIFCGSVLDEEVGMYYQFCPDHNGDTIVVETSEDEFGDEEEAEDELEVINNDHIQRISPSRYRHLLERNDLSVSSYDPSSLRGRRASSITFDDSGSNIDVLILWTHEAECGNAGLDPKCVHTAQTEAVMRARIALAVEEANTAYALSGIDLVLRAVHTYREPTGYVEYDDPDKSSIGSTALRDIATDGDGLMDDVHLKRTQYGADMVALVVNYGGGVAYRSTPTASIGSQFSVTGWVKATGRFTFAHELGHNMGCNHDKGTKNACSTSDTNYGYRDPQARFRSIMAYGCPSSAECDGVTKAGTYSTCVRVQRFSNMYSNYPWGDGSSPIGTSTVNNAAHISTYKHIISGFYDTVVCSSSSECDDGNDCTADECLATGHCRHTQIPNCCGNGACEAGENYLSCESDCAQELVTTFNGDSTRRGEMFDVTATNSIDIFGFEIHAEDYGVSRDMEVWTRSGTYQDNGESSSGWTKVLDQTGVVGLGERWGTPLNHFTTPISMAAGETRAFFIYSTVGDLGCTYAEGLGFGTILKYDDNVQVKIGVGLSGYFSGDFTKERSPNVVLKYTTGGSSETLSPVASPTPLPPTAPQDPILTYVSNGGSNYGMCEGDCDSHDDCQAGLMCYQRSGGDPVPGCVGSDSSSTDYCTLPALNDIGNGLSAGSYELCQGDCDSDEDCLGPNLRCFQRNGYDPVPGCEGGGTGSNNWDYCVLDETVSPTPSPTSAPTPYDNCSSNPCAHGACTDEVGGYTCTCSTGWEGGNCDEDIDECARGTDNCDDNNASCTNSAGSFTCSCNPGFAGDGVTCIDTDECTLGTDNCGSNAFCTNTFGGYTCSCNQGFAGDGITCTDEDECALGTANCHSDASCINTAGSFSCSCNNGFEGDGITCVKITDAPTNSPSAHPSSPPTPLPVISPAPTPLPTPIPSKSPTASPTPIPTKSPVVSTPTNPSLTYVGNGGSNYGMCEGDCDSHADCQQAGLGLMCYQRSGGDPVPGCVGGESDSSSTDYCTLPALNDIGNGLSAGSYELCQGDCDSDEDCFGPNICHQRNGYDPVPGCEGLGTNNYDYCILPPPTSAPVQLPTTSSPTKSPAATNQLTYISNGGSGYGMCEGDCDSHDDCQAGLMCYQRSGGDPVPGCIGSDSSSTDYCTLPTLNDIGNNLSNGSYDLCQGDCDDDSDCKGELLCSQRSGYDPVPGCSGLGRNHWDYCIAPP